MRNDMKDTIWNVSDDGDFIVDRSGKVVCQFFDKRENDFSDKAENVHVVAAAPELLAALDAIIDGWHDADEATIAEAGKIAVAKRLVERIDLRVRLG